MCLDYVWGWRGIITQAEQDSTKATGFIPSPQLIRSLQGQILSPAWLGPAEPYHPQGQKASSGSSLTLGPLTFFFTQVIHIHYRKTPHHSLLDTSTNTSPLVSRHTGTWARGPVPWVGYSGSLAPLPLS